MQQYSPEEQRLTGEPELIFRGTELGFTEGPHMYHIDGWYYLMTAEGGTAQGHAIMMASSRSMHGPFEVDPKIRCSPRGMHRTGRFSMPGTAT